VWGSAFILKAATLQGGGVRSNGACHFCSGGGFENGANRSVVAFANVKEQREALLALELSRCQRLLLGAGAVPTS
jgi:hypothetical protein